MTDQKKTPDATPDSRVMELEEKIMFQQRTLEELNGVVLQQQNDLDQLRREFESLRSTTQGLIDRGTGEDLPHEKPPHY